MQLKINFHSLIDVITNSSTEIFTTTSSSAISELKELINLMLREAGVDKTADDLYEFKEEYDDYAKERIAEYYRDSLDEDDGTEMPVETRREIDDMSDEDLYKWMVENDIDVQRFVDQDRECGYPSTATEIIITSKATGEVIDISNKLLRLFDQEAYYN